LATGAALPDDLADLPLRWVGLVAFADPLRESVPGAVAEASAAGLRVLMLTGDHARTAAAIAHQAGLADGELVVGGAELDALDDEQLDRRLRDARVFARRCAALARWSA
jgi:Ca2+-transporting ATPase